MAFLSKSHNVKVTKGAQMCYNKTLKTNKRLDACFSRVLVWFIKQLTFEFQAENFNISSGFWRLQSTSLFISRSHLLSLKPTKTSGEFPFFPFSIR